MDSGFTAPMFLSRARKRARSWALRMMMLECIMPTSTKVFLSKTIQPETPEFLQDLHVSKEDIQLLKRYNMLSVM